MPFSKAVTHLFSCHFRAHSLSLGSLFWIWTKGNCFRAGPVRRDRSDKPTPLPGDRLFVTRDFPRELAQLVRVSVAVANSDNNQLATTCWRYDVGKLSSSGGAEPWFNTVSFHERVKSMVRFFDCREVPTLTVPFSRRPIICHVPDRIPLAAWRQGMSLAFE